MKNEHLSIHTNYPRLLKLGSTSDCINCVHFQVHCSLFFCPISLCMQQATEGGGRESGEEEEGEVEKREGAAVRLLLRERTAEATGKTWTSASSQTQGNW